MKLQYLGTAAAEAIPAVFCNCEVCRKSRELGGRHLRTRSQALVNDDLLIDFPCDAYAHALRFGIDYSKIDHCIITHTHGDHLFPWELNHLKLHNQYERGVFHVFGSEDVEAAISGPVANAKGFLQFISIIVIYCQKKPSEKRYFATILCKIERRKTILL